MNEHLGMLLDGGSIDHGIVDAFWAAAFVALFSTAGWIIVRLLTRMDKRHTRAEAKFNDVDDNIANVRHHVHLPPWRSHKNSDSDEE